MATKRGPSSELNHDNWDEDDKSEDAGQFAQASSDILKDRVIKKAKRRVIGATGADSTSIFAGFGGFNSAPKKPDGDANPFEFLVKPSATKESEGSLLPAKKTYSFDLPVNPLEGKITPVFQFGTGNAPREPSKPSSGFSIGEKKPTGFNFGASNPSFVFGAADKSAGGNNGFKFGTNPLSTTPKANISFGTPAMKPDDKDMSKRSFSFGGSPSKPIEDDPPKIDSEKPAAQKISGDVTLPEPALKPTEKLPSLLEMFKPKPGSWKCLICDITNTVEKECCDACLTPKPGAASPSSKAQPKKWECPTCMVPNNPDKLKCVCCETPNPESSVKSTTEPSKNFGNSSITTSGFKFGTVDGSSSLPPASNSGFNLGALQQPAKADNGFRFGVSTNNTQTKPIEADTIYPPEFLADLKELNISVTEWIKNHVDKNGFIYLTPIFEDYDKHLLELKEQFKIKDSNHEVSINNTALGTNGLVEKKKDATPELKTGFSFGTSATTEPRSGFSFGSGPFTSGETKGFSLGAPTSSFEKKPEFSFGSSSSDNNKPAFSFGSNPTGFTFGSIASKTLSNDKPASQESGDEDDAPPKVEVSSVVEEDSLFSIRCKIFYKKGSEFVEKGLGMLHLKPLDAEGANKTQLLIRAETNLGNILLNVMLNSKMNFLRRNNNLQFVCIPNPSIPGVESGPVTMLIRVKNAEAATDLETHINARIVESN